MPDRASKLTPIRPVPAAEPTPERIIRAAYECFDRFGIAKTTIEDIAASVGVTRATVYKYFSSKDDIIDRISERETAEINAEVRRLFVKKASIEDSLTECLFLIVRAAARSRYVREVLRSVEYPSRSADTRSAGHQKQRRWWGALLENAAHSGQLAADLSIDEIVSWLTLAEQLLLIKVDSVEISDAELSQFIRRMVVLPVLAKSAASPVPPMQRPSKVRRVGAR